MCKKNANQFIDNCEIPFANQSSQLNENTAELQSVQIVQKMQKVKSE